MFAHNLNKIVTIISETDSVELTVASVSCGRLIFCSKPVCPSRTGNVNCSNMLMDKSVRTLGISCLTSLSVPTSDNGNICL